VVNNASVLGLRPIAGSPIYCASKAAVINLTKSAALEFATQGVRVNAVCPAIIETEMTKKARSDDQIRNYLLGVYPMRRFCRSEEVAAASSTFARRIPGSPPGCALPVDGGFAV
jgi:NAD(P)-dependent dehydrogenase (short-subunit alcohol dehydrogenase family)